MFEKFDVEYKEYEIIKVKLPAGENTTTCLKCNDTCHLNCLFADNNEKILCGAMADGYCTECIDNCFWNVHKNIPYVLKHKVRKYHKSSQEIVEKLQKNSQKICETLNKTLSTSTKTVNIQLLIEVLSNEYAEMSLHCMKVQEAIRESINSAKKDDLKENLLFCVEQYTELMLKSEENEMKEGFESRINSLEDMKKQYALVRKACQKEGIEFSEFFEKEKLLQDFKKVIKQSLLNN